MKFKNQLKLNFKTLLNVILLKLIKTLTDFSDHSTVLKTLTLNSSEIHLGGLGYIKLVREH